MSTSRPSKPGQRQADYANFGYAGRKTGVVLRDTGIRDEYGMPNIDDLFSPPPESAPSSKEILLLNGTLGKEDETNHGLGSQRDNTTYSSPRRSVPPRARSPIKTSIGSPRKSLNSSPTKTMALLASPVRMRAPVQVNLGDLDRANGSTFLNNKHKRRSLEQAPKRPPVPVVTSKPRQQQTIRRSLFDIPSSPAVSKKAEAPTGRIAAPSPTERGVQDTISLHATRSKTISSPIADKLPYVNGSRIAQDVEEVSTRQRTTLPTAPSNDTIVSTKSPQKSKDRSGGKSRRRFSDIEAAEREPPSQPEIPLQVDDYQFEPDIGGFDDAEIDFGPDLDLPAEPESELEAPQEEDSDNPVNRIPEPGPAASISLERSPQGKFSNSNLKRRSPLHDNIREDSPPMKKQRQVMPPPSKPTSRTINGQGKVKPVTGSSKVTLGKAQPILASISEPVAPLSPLRKTRPKGRGLQIVKDKIATEVDGARYTRSGRTSVKPVEYWRGERIIYSEPKREGGRVSLPGIMDVIRIEDEPQITRSSKTRKPGRSKRRQPSVDSEDEPEEEWEIEPGVLVGEVPGWNRVEQRADPEYPEQIDLALAPPGIAALTKKVQGASFQFAKNLQLPFFHSGMVDLPSGGEKKTKNSRQFHMVFWVFSGRVVVDVSGNRFSLGRGGMWQVPRGNAYSVNNPYNKPARLVFSQGCYMTEAQGEAYEEAEAAGVPQE